MDRIKYIPHEDTSPRALPQNMITSESKKQLKHFRAENMNEEQDKSLRFNKMGIKWKIDTKSPRQSPE